MAAFIYFWGFAKAFFPRENRATVTDHQESKTVLNNPRISYDRASFVHVSVRLAQVQAAQHQNESGTLDHWNEKALPGFLASTVDTVRSVRKLHEVVRQTGAMIVTGHDPEAWPTFQQAPRAYQ
jgi:hypothetical protein